MSISGLFVVVDPEPHRVLRPDDELIFAGLGRQHRALPVHPELLRELAEQADGDRQRGQRDVVPRLLLDGVLGRDRAVDAEVEADLRVNAIEGVVAAPPPPRRRRAARAVLPLEPAPIVPAGLAAEAADQVGQGVPVLAHGQPRQLDPRRPHRVAGLRGPGVERVVDIGGHLVGVRAHAGAGLVLRHGLGDQLRQAGHRALADQRARIMVVGPLARCPVARRAHLSIDLLARPRLGLALVVVVLGARPDQQGDQRQGQPGRRHRAGREAESDGAAAPAGATDHGRASPLHWASQRSRRWRWDTPIPTRIREAG